MIYYLIIKQGKFDFSSMVYPLRNHCINIMNFDESFCGICDRFDITRSNVHKHFLDIRRCSVLQMNICAEAEFRHIK